MSSDGGGVEFNVDHDDHEHLVFAFDIKIYRDILRKEVPNKKFKGDDPQEWLETLNEAELARVAEALRRYAATHAPAMVIEGVNIDPNLTDAQRRDAIMAIARMMFDQMGRTPGSLVPKAKKDEGMRSVHLGHRKRPGSKTKKDKPPTAFERAKNHFWDDDEEDD